MSTCPDGGIGRRAGFKIQFWQQSVGSIPTPGTEAFFRKGEGFFYAPVFDLISEQFFFPEGNMMIAKKLDVLFAEGFVQMMLLMILNEAHGTLQL